MRDLALLLLFPTDHLGPRGLGDKDIIQWIRGCLPGGLVQRLGNEHVVVLQGNCHNGSNELLVSHDFCESACTCMYVLKTLILCFVI